MNTTLTSVIPTGVRPSALRWSNGVEEPVVSACAQVLALILLAALLPSAALAQELPQGWRRATRTETSDDWRKKSPTRFLVIKGDFDRDGRQDLAELFVNSSSRTFALFVRLASDGEWRKIGEEREIESLADFGIAAVKPGRYKTACGKGYGDWACAHGEPDHLKLSTTAVDIFAEESSDWIFYWEPARKTFREVQMSD